MSAGESFHGRPPIDLESDELCLERILDIEPTLIPVMEEIAKTALCQAVQEHDCVEQE